jgi:UDP-N-acetylmuramate dehydrogenase
MRIEEHYSLEKHNSFHLPVKTRWFVEYDTEEELFRILNDEYFGECDSIHIGGGCNLLFLNDYNGIILHSSIKGITLAEETPEAVCLRIGAGEVWDDVVACAAGRGWYGIENLSGIPGECGGAAVQNIGAYGTEIKDVIEAVETCNHRGEKQIFNRAECRYAYRHSRFKEEGEGAHIITHIRIRLSKTPRLALHYGNIKESITAQYGEEATLPDIRRTIIAIRKEKLPDPAQIGNAGSFFMNPLIPLRQFETLKTAYPGMPFFPATEGYMKIPAAWLIEQCGFKGKSYGEAGVYEKQALVLVNRGHATGQDIALLAAKIRATVAERFHIELKPEVKYIGVYDNHPPHIGTQPVQ